MRQVKKIIVNWILFVKRNSIFFPDFLIKFCIKNNFLQIIDTRTNIETKKNKIKNAIRVSRFKVKEYKFTKKIYILIGSGERNMIPELRHIRKNKIMIFMLRQGIENPLMKSMIN